MPVTRSALNALYIPWSWSLMDGTVAIRYLPIRLVKKSVTNNPYNLFVDTGNDNSFSDHNSSRTDSWSNNTITIIKIEDLITNYPISNHHNSLDTMESLDTLESFDAYLDSCLNPSLDRYFEINSESCADQLLSIPQKDTVKQPCQAPSRILTSNRIDLTDDHGIIIYDSSDADLLATSWVIEHTYPDDIYESNREYLIEDTDDEDMNSPSLIYDTNPIYDVMVSCNHQPKHRCYLTFSCCNILFSCIKCHNDFMTSSNNYWYPKHTACAQQINMVRCRHCSELQFPDNICIECDTVLKISICKYNECDVIDIEGNELSHCSSCDVCHIKSDEKNCGYTIFQSL